MNPTKTVAIFSSALVALTLASGSAFARDPSPSRDRTVRTAATFGLIPIIDASIRAASDVVEAPWDNPIDERWVGSLVSFEGDISLSGTGEGSDAKGDALDVADTGDLESFLDARLAECAGDARCQLAVLSLDSPPPWEELMLASRSENTEQR